LRHAGGAEEVVALRAYGCEEEELADLVAVSNGMHLMASLGLQRTGQRSSCATSSREVGSAVASAMLV
jgi:hypothetical protein